MSDDDPVTINIHPRTPFGMRDTTTGRSILGPLGPLASRQFKVSDFSAMPSDDLRHASNNALTKVDGQYATWLNPDAWGDYAWRTMPVMHWQYPEELKKHVQQHGYAPFGGIDRFNRHPEHLRNVVKAVSSIRTKQQRRLVVINWNSPVT